MRRSRLWPNAEPSVATMTMVMTSKTPMRMSSESDLSLPAPVTRFSNVIVPGAALDHYTTLVLRKC